MSKFVKPVAIAVCALAAAAVATTADARPRKRHRYSSDVIVVHPRAKSWLNPGTVVPVGSRNAYVQEMTWFNYQPYERFSPGILWRPFPYQR